MACILITGSGGLIGSEAARFFHDLGLEVHGIDNDMRRYFFGHEASTAWRVQQISAGLKNYHHHHIDIRDREAVAGLVAQLGPDLKYVLHAAAQPSHDWAATEPLTDFGVNALGTLILLEAVRMHAPEAAFAFLSTNKVYGDAPNELPLVETATRWEIAPDHPYAACGIDESLRIDASTHSVFGASKVAADVMVQEYGRYFGLNTACFRGGCLTGSGHSGSELHGFLAYLMKCTVIGRPYTVYGYKGKQVRDNIHSYDLVNAIWHFFQKPRRGAVYNIGGTRSSNCSMLEAIGLCERVSGRRLAWSYSDQNRTGDHIWWISDMSRFQSDYPDYRLTYDIPSIIEEMHENNRFRLLEAV
ncbi:NAD-dependent epimerase/dehydratase family protein [Enterovirga sp.]|jgi:CDP-paratose 2-epimerase|uniref:NAD-dependent epimerase/dehydratase family protein n=1 Tax=Enterovirga sp. TaxID=2026350 RepID=UPI0026381F47|nr:NAD-dependent epimerase/dehydratase family protein [Enterovirga sp.]MDB5591869.1 NAD-dependent epimerase [Enterovirga sp.]